MEYIEYMIGKYSHNNRTGCCSIAKSCPAACNPMDCSVPGFPVLHYLPEFAWIHVHWFSDAISFSVDPFSCPQSFPVSGSFPMSWLGPVRWLGLKFLSLLVCCALPANICQIDKKPWTTNCLHNNSMSTQCMLWALITPFSIHSLNESKHWASSLNCLLN